MKIFEINYDSIRCNSWVPFVDVVLDFLTFLKENKKIALFEKQKTLFEYQTHCSKNATTIEPTTAYKAMSASPLQALKPTQY